jgi:transposase
MKTYVGIDYHKRFSYGTIMTEAGTIVKQAKFNNHPEAVAAFLGEFGSNGCSAVLEAGYNSLVMHDWLDELIGSVTLADPLKVKAIAEAKIKTDKIDSATLAHLLRCDLIPPAHVSSPAARIGKKLLRHRMFLVRLSTMVKNRIHSLIDGFPLIRDSRLVKDIFSKKGIGWLRQIELPKYAVRILDDELSLLEYLGLQIKHIDSGIGGFGRKDQRVKNVMTVPGLGKFFSLLVVSEIDDIDRFRTPAKLHAYAGLVPSTYSSGGRTYHGRIIKQGNKYLRYAMIEAVWPALSKSVDLERVYNRVYSRRGGNSAKVAAARRLLTIVYRVLKENRGYRYRY